jgi:hypothetical protein
MIAIRALSAILNDLITTTIMTMTMTMTMTIVQKRSTSRYAGRGRMLSSCAAGWIVVRRERYTLLWRWICCRKMVLWREGLASAIRLAASTVLVG